MFFRHHITTIFVTRGKITSAVFSTAGKIIKEAKVYDWSEENLSTILADIASRGPNVARVVFGEEFSYVTALNSSKTDRENVLEKAQEIIPDELANNWDFKKEKDLSFSSQVIAVQPHILDFFVENMNKAGFQIEAIEPQSIALARLVPKVGLFLFIVEDGKLLMGAVFNGIVVATYVSEEKKDVSMLERFVLSVQKKCNTKTEIIFINKRTTISRKILLARGLRYEILDLDPLYAVAMKKHLAGEDSSVLNINPVKKSPKKQVLQKELAGDNKIIRTNSRFSFREKMLTGLFIALVVAGGIFIKTKYEKSAAPSIISVPKKQTVFQNESVIPPSEQQQQTPAEIIKSETAVIKSAKELQILILNGGAVPGSAGKVKDTLSAEGYLNIEAKNASSSDNIGVVVYYQALNEENVAQIKEDLQKTHPKAVAKEATSEEEKSAEIVIILGK